MAEPQDETPTLDIAEGAEKIGGLGILGEIEPSAEEDTQIDDTGVDDGGEDPTGSDELDSDEDELDDDGFEDDDDDGFEDDDDGAEDDDDEGGDDQTFTVKVDGEEVEVTLDEALAGYQRQQDYTRKTMAVAEERRKTAEHVKALTEIQGQYAERLEVVERMYAVPENVDWAEVKRQDPDNYESIRAQYDQRAAMLADIREEKAELERQANARREELQSISRDKLEAAIPEWADSEVRERETERMVHHATQTYGWAPKDIEMAIDHRVFLMLRDAMLYREQLAEGEEVEKEVRGKQKKTKATLKPGNPDRKTSSKTKRSRRQLSQAKKNLRESGSINDAATAIGNLVDI